MATTILDLKNISCEIGARSILESVSFTVYSGDRVGIIGDNGCGKTTLLNIITGKMSDLEVGGEYMVYTKDVGYLSQKTGEDNRNITVYEDFASVFSELSRMEEEIALLESKLGEDSSDNTSNRLSKLYETYNENGGLTYKSRLKSTLSGLKFTEDMYNLPVKNLSGGQKIRLALGKLLLTAPSLLLLDEPTNHLDSESILFLEDQLKNYRGTVIIVSHDRYFLDTITTKTLLIDHGYGTLYNAPYSKYKVLREADIEYQKRMYAIQQKEIAHIKDVIDQQKRWNQEHNYVTAENWQKKLDRIELIDDPTASKETAIKIHFEPDKRGGNEVLHVNDLSFGYSSPLFENFNLDLRRGERLVITGPNGCGKSTFLKILVGELHETKGSIKLGANINVSYYSQDFAELNLDNTPFMEIFEKANYDYYHNQGGLPKFHNITMVRNALAAFGFTGDDVFKKIELMSGGEKARLALLKLTYNKANLLILDEPTNHLDIRTCELLEDAIKEFDGTVIIVSHDRYFVNSVATKTISLGDYAPFASAPSEKEKTSKDDYLKAKEDRANKSKQKRQEENLKKEIESLEKRISELDEILNDSSRDYSEISKAYTEKEECASKLSKAEDEYLIIICGE